MRWPEQRGLSWYLLYLVSSSIGLRSICVNE